MKKIYTIIAVAALTLSVSAQTSNRTTNKVIRTIGAPINSVTTSTSTVLSPASIGATSSCSLAVYLAGATGDGGYIPGTNQYGDMEKAQKFDLATYGLSTPATVSAAGAIFAVMTDGGNSSTATAKIYSDVAGEPGVLLGTSLPLTISSIITNTTTSFLFSSPVTLTGNLFYVSIDISNLDATTGDTLAIYQTNDACTDNATTASWELGSDNTWYDFESDWGFTSTDLAILALVTADIPTGIKKQSTDLGSISPNPSNGLFNVKIANNEAVTITVTNAIGQTVVAKNFNANESVSFDLSNQNNGVYFVTITNGNEKSIKKVVLNK